MSSVAYIKLASKILIYKLIISNHILMYLANFQMFALYYSHDKNDDVQHFTHLEKY